AFANRKRSDEDISNWRNVFMRKLLLFMIFSGFVSIPVFADSINVLFGYALPRGDSDVYTQNEAETTFRVKDLNDFVGTVGSDHFFGEHISLGGDFAYYQGQTTVQDVDFIFPSGQPIFRDIRLEIVPLEIGLKVLPIGRNVPVIPYFGGGGGLY